MSNNLDSGLLNEGPNKKMMHKNAQLAFILLIFSIIYATIDVIEWYLYFHHSPLMNRSGRHFYYNFYLLPLVSFTEIILSIAGYYYYYKAFKIQLLAATSNDRAMQDKGVRYFNTSLILAVIYFLIIFGNILFRVIVIR